jgi:hypothetical protein
MPAGPVRQVRKSYPGSPATTPRGGNGQPPVKRAPECRWDTAHVRFFPHGAVRITGRREIHLRSLQPLPLHLANSIFLGDCLTSEGQPDTDELEVVSGRVVIPQFIAACPDLSVVCAWRRGCTSGICPIFATTAPIKLASMAQANAGHSGEPGRNSPQLAAYSQRFAA